MWHCYFCILGNQLLVIILEEIILCMMYCFLLSSVLTRIQVTLRDTVMRLEHVPENANRGVALEMRIEV